MTTLMISVAQCREESERWQDKIFRVLLKLLSARQYDPLQRVCIGRHLVAMRQRYNNAGGEMELPLETQRMLLLLEPSDWNTKKLNEIQPRLLEPLVNYWSVCDILLCIAYKDLPQVQFPVATHNLNSLHWFPVNYCIPYKLMSTTLTLLCDFIAARRRGSS